MSHKLFPLVGSYKPGIPIGSMQHLRRKED